MDSHHHHHPLSSYYECCHCNNIVDLHNIVYVAPEDGVDFNFFPELGNLCKHCSRLMLYSEARKNGIYSKSLTGIKYLILNKKNPRNNVELILLLISIIDNRKYYDKD